MRNSALLVLSLLIVIRSGWAASSPVSEAPDDGISRLHWLGERQIAMNANSTNFVGIWNLRESAKLRAQTLDKLSTAPWRLLRGKPADPASAKLRPLLDDLVQEEWYAEIRSVTNRPDEMVLAIHLSAGRQALWDTNLAAVLESLTSIQPEHTADGWSLRKHHFPDLIQLEHSGQWLVLGAARETNPLMQDLITRIQRDDRPGEFSASNSWFDGNIDVAGLAGIFPAGWQPPQTLQRITLTVTGDGSNVVSRGDLTFSKPLPVKLEPWNVPTNLIDGQVSSITAARGVRPLLEKLESSCGMNPGAPPDQIFFWSTPGLPAQEYFAATVADATNEVRALIRYLANVINPLAAKTDNGAIVPSEASVSAEWERLPFLTPSLQIVPVGEENFIWAGTMPLVPPFSHPSPSVLKFISMGSNLICYNSENTGSRTETWLYILQLMRMATGKAQLPPDSLGIAWLKAAAPKLGNCTTTLTLTAPAELSFSRESAVGFSAIELQLLADWLESPQFPHGLNTFVGVSKIPGE